MRMIDAEETVLAPYSIQSVMARRRRGRRARLTINIDAEASKGRYAFRLTFPKGLYPRPNKKIGRIAPAGSRLKDRDSAPLTPTRRPANMSRSFNRRRGAVGADSRIEQDEILSRRRNRRNARSNRAR